MKFACFGYYSEKSWEGISQAAQDAIVDECLSFDEDVLRKGGHFVSGEALAPSAAARTVRSRDGKSWSRTARTPSPRSRSGGS